MFYRESGQFKTSYAADQAIFPIKQDNWGMVLLLLIAFFAVPYFGTEYFFIFTKVGKLNIKVN